MNPDDFYISIPKPCHQDWDKMSPEEKGRFCKACNKKVFDFSGSDKAEVVKALTDSADQICIRVPSRFLSQVTHHKQSISYGKRFLYSALALVGFSNFLPHSAKAQVRMRDSLQVNNAIPQVSCIEGIVKKKGTGWPLRFVSVSAEIDSVTIITVLSDSNGYYRLHIPQQYRDSIFTLKFSVAGYQNLLVTNIQPGTEKRFVQHAEMTSISMPSMGIESITMGIPARTIYNTWENTDFFDSRSTHKPLNDIDLLDPKSIWEIEETEE